MSITEDDLTKERIIELARLHPVVAHYYCLWEMKRLTWEQANYGIILALIERNTSMAKDLLALHKTSFSPVLSEISKDMLDQVANLPKGKLLSSPVLD